MTVTLRDNGMIVLQGVCQVDEAEQLLGYLQSFPDAGVDWTACDWAHTAVIQILLGVRPAMRGAPQGIFLKRFVAPLLAQADSRPEGSD